MATIYKTSATPEDGKTHVIWSSSEAAARKAKHVLAEEHCISVKSIAHEAVDIPTTKAGLIEWLNENLTTQGA